MATAWAVMTYLGKDGYCRLTALAIETAERIRAGIRGIEGLTVLGEPHAHLHAIAVAPGSEEVLDAFEIGDAMQARGWFHDRQKPPDSLHATVSAGNAGVVDEYLADLAECVAACAGARAADRSTSYATLE
jgi:glutamate/tyrosine decarboxylase-like PLP-dependent enzyme